MALAATDLLVVQQQTGDQLIKKLAIQDLQTYLQSAQPVTFKGTANMTVGGDEPAVEDRVAGNLYLNSATQAGTFAWQGGADPFTGTVQPNAQAVWVDTLGWQVTANGAGGGVGVEEVLATAPIQVDSSDPASPRVSVLDADATRLGVVQLATEQDVIDGTAGKVVTSAQLAATNQAISDAGGGTVLTVAGLEPIVITGEASSTPTVTITAASTSAVGAVQLEDASSIDTSSTSTATTPKYVADYYLIKDFSSLDSITD